MAASDDQKGFSYFQKTVCLYEWWLVRANTEIQGKRLAVAGHTSRGDEAVVRVFTSAPILKAYDVFTLETTDGVSVMIKGFINKDRTLENGFPYEVCSYFRLGFPSHWEACAVKFLGQRFAIEDVSLVDPNTRNSNVITEENYENVNIEENVDISASNVDPKLDQDGGYMFQKAFKKFNKAGGSRSKVSGAENNDPKESTDAKKESLLKEACTEKFLELDFACEFAINVEAGTTDSSEVAEENYEKTITEKTISLSPCIVASKMDKGRTDITNQEVSKKSNKAVKFSSMRGGAKNEGQKKIIGTEKSNSYKEARSAIKKTKRKLTYGSPVTSRGSCLTSVVSPESFSCKRSRSGRLLLPKLEFWRNQTAVYDADRQITGIKDDINTPSRGIKSEPPIKRKKHT